MGEIKMLLLGFFLGLISAAFGTWLAHLFTIGRDRRAEFNKACIEFRSTFKETIIRLKYSTDSVFDILHSDVLIKHEAAMEQFRLSLRAGNRLCFDLAWKDYFKHYPNPNEENKAPKHIPSEWDEKDEKKVVLSKIHALLFYATLK